MKTVLLAMLLLAQRPAAAPVQTGSITGRLLNTDGTPAVRIRVSAMPAPDSSAKPVDGSTLMTLTETDSDGRYRLADIPVGRYYVVAGVLDSPTYYPRGTLPAGATAINVVAGTSTANIDFRIEGSSSSFSVSGRVTFETTSARSFMNSQVRLTGGPGSFASYTELSATPGPDGSFEILHVRSGAYVLNVTPAPFFNPASIIVADKDVRGIEVVVPWTTDVIGQVAVENNAGPTPPIALMFSGAGRQTPTYQSSQGFRVTLGEGYYAVSLTGLPSGFYVKSINAESTDLLTKPFRVAKDQTIPAIAVTLGVSTPSPWVKISGHIAPADSKVNLLSLSGTSGSYEARISADGSFEFPKILPGTYSASLRSSVPTIAAIQQSFSLIVPIRDLNGIELKVPAVREISGRVVVDGIGPMVRPTLSLTTPPDSGVAVPAAAGAVPTLGQLFLTAPAGRSLQTNLNINLQQDGSFKTALPEGQYRLAASIPNIGAPPYTVKELRYGNINLLTEPFDVSAEPKELLVKLAPPSSTVKVSGRVLGLPESPSANATVTLFNPLFLNGPVASVSTDGSFEFPKVFSGTYTARVLSPSMNSIAIPMLNVTVTDRDVTNLQFVVPRVRDISGKITLEGRGLLPVFNLLLSSVANGLGGNQQSMTVNPQADGSFKLTIADGNWYIVRPNNLPSGYNIKDITYGSTSVLNSALKVNSDLSELRITVATTNVTPVKVRGKVTNVEAIPLQNPPAAVVMSAQGYAGSLQAPIASDGSFEFPEVLPGTYTARLSLILSNLRTMTTTVNVGARDVSDVVIAIPRTAEITGKIILEGRGAMPRFAAPLTYGNAGPNTGAASMFSLLNIIPAADGMFKLTVPVIDWRLGTVSGLPLGYTLKSMMSGTTDLLTSAIDFKSGTMPEMRIVIAAPDVAPVKVSGKVTNLDAIPVRTPPIGVVLDGQGIAVPLQSAISADGSFEFPEVFPGSYTARLSVSLPTVGTASAALNVGPTGVTDVRLAIPRAVEIGGKVLLKGRGAMPRLIVTFVNDLTAAGANAPPVTGTVSINPSADGSFKVSVSDINRRAGGVIGLPPGYVVKSMMLGSTDILKSPTEFNAGTIPELLIVIATPDKPPVKVSGKVTGLETSPGRGQARIRLTGVGYALPIETSVASDGTFEFSGIYPGSYTAIVTGIPNLAPPSSAVVVDASDVKDMIVQVQASVEIRGRVIVEGGGPAPRLTFVPSQANVTPLGISMPPGAGPPLSTSMFNISPNVDGTFRLAMPEGERPIGKLTSLPSGYSLKSVSYGSTDLLRSSLKISRGDTSEFLAVLSAIGVKPVAVRGQVDGADMSALAQGTTRILLNSSTYASAQTAIVKSDATFEFPNVYPGNYTAQVLGPGAGTPGFVPGNTPVPANAGPAVPPPPRTNVIVGDQDVTNVRVAAPAQ